MACRALSAALLLCARLGALSFVIPPCSLNGVLAGGSCVCDAGWTGAACHELKLLPAAVLSAETQTYFHPTNGGAAGGGFVSNSWGISVARDDSGSLWHGFMTELGGNCSLSSYGSASRILHMTAPSAEGPWAVAGVALNRFAHNPQVVRGGDGSWLLFHIGAEEPTGCDTERCPGEHNASCAMGGHGTSVARAASPYGPWERVPYILPDNETNPSAIVLPDATLAVTARRWTAGVPIYTAASWRGPYVAAPRVNVTLVRAGAPAADAYTPFDEDAFLYTDARGGFHMLTHRQPNGTACPQGPNPSQCDCTGGHMYAPAIMGPWFVDLALVYNCSLATVSGFVTLAARQRPTLLLPSRGGGQPPCPILFTGASTDPKSQYYSSFTMQQHVNCSGS